MTDSLATRLGANMRQLRQTRGVTQQQLAKLAQLPRATWSNLESGSANPTLEVLHKVALALGVSIEELLATPKAEIKLYKSGSLPHKQRGPVLVNTLLPDEIPGLQLERLRIPIAGRLIGVPHTPGTREYLTCESGEIELVASGSAFRLHPGDVVVFPGDQRHSYANLGRAIAIGYSVLVFAPRS